MRGSSIVLASYTGFWFAVWFGCGVDCPWLTWLDDLGAVHFLTSTTFHGDRERLTGNGVNFLVAACFRVDLMECCALNPSARRSRMRCMGLQTDMTTFNTRSVSQTLGILGFAFASRCFSDFLGTGTGWLALHRWACVSFLLRVAQ